MKISFTGHRNIEDEGLTAELDRTILEYVQGDDVTFLSGMAQGFDLLAAERVLAARQLHDDVRLCCVVPYSAQARSFSESDRRRYALVLEQADEVIELESHYSHGVYYRRNKYLIEHSEIVIAYYDGLGKGGTAYTIRCAKQKRREIRNLYPTMQYSLF